MTDTKVKFILPLPPTLMAQVWVERIEIGEHTVMSVMTRNWKKLSVGDTVTIKMFGSKPMIIFGGE